MADVSMNEFGRLSLGYTESLGHPKLREQIAETYSEVSTDDVVMLGTPVEGIYLVARTDPNVPKHRGISEFIFPTNLTGITIT